jgi:hypothetical protein
MSDAITVGIHMVYNHIPDIVPTLLPKADAACGLAAYAVKAQIMASMGEPKTGRSYARGRIGRKASANTKGLRTYQTKKGTTMGIVGYKVHRASAPGQAPAIDTGHLINTISVQHVRQCLWQVGVSAAYAMPLEFGTADGKLAPRPFMRPACKIVFPSFAAAMESLRIAP